VDCALNILIADDDDLCRGLIGDAIDSDNVNIFLASDGIEALSILNEDNIDILITDLNMPKMDGLILIDHARQINPNIISIIITGFGSLESAIKAIRHGAYDYVQKPFSVERIAVVARNAVEKARILRDKTRLLRELDTAYHSLKILETQSSANEESESRRVGSSLSNEAHYVLAQQALPPFYYDSPVHSSSQLLTHLERLNELKRNGGISDDEFALLKMQIIKHSRLA
jgi:DNA-binding NtrC family response regulator